MKVPRKFTPEEVALIHRTMMKNASPDDVKVFVATCERTGLDPFAKQIMPTSRQVNKNGTWVTIWGSLTTVDGLRKIAVDTGEYEGQEGPFWCGQNGNWKDLWTESKPPFAAKVLVHRKGFRTGLSGVARYDAFVQKKKDGAPNQVWATMPDHMTGKCAEALALRRAFPNEMAGLYTEEEGGAAEIIQAAEVEHAEEQNVEWTEDERQNAGLQIADFAEILYNMGLEKAEVDKIIERPQSTIGDVELTYDKWANRLASYSERKIAQVKVDRVPNDIVTAATGHDA